MKLRKYAVMFLQVIGVLLLLGLIALYVYCAPINHPGLAKQVLFHPESRFAPTSNELSKADTHEDIYFGGAPGTKLNGWFFRKPYAQYVVLFSHGNAGNIGGRLHKVQRLLDQGVSVFIYDYEGFGKSTGAPSQQGIIDDGCAAYDVLTKQKHYRPQQIVLYGESIGTAVSTQVSKQRQCAGIVLESAFISTLQLARDKVMAAYLYPWFLWPGELNNMIVLRDQHPPLLIIHGMKDDLINYSHGKRLFAASPEPKAIALLPHCNHSNIGFELDTDMYVDALKTFFQKVKQTQTVASN